MTFVPPSHRWLRFRRATVLVWASSEIVKPETASMSVQVVAGSWSVQRHPRSLECCARR